MYSSKFVFCLLHNGHIHDGKKDGTVALPFGSEYGLRFRNKNDRRAVVRFTIDGEDVSGGGFVIPPQSAIDIFRHAHKDAKFKFVDLDSEAAADFGKTENVEGEKGVIEAKFYLEKAKPVAPVEHHHHHYHPRPKPYYPPYPYWYYPTWTDQGQYTHKYDPSHKDYTVWYSNNTNQAGGMKSSMSYNADASVMGSFSSHSTGDGDVQTGFDPVAFGEAPKVNPEWGTRRQPRQKLLRKQLKEGCTVEGGASGQKFGKVDIDLETDFVALKLVLRGYAPDSQVEQVVEAQDATHCTNCGAKRLRKSDKFCGSCGTKF